MSRQRLRCRLLRESILGRAGLIFLAKVPLLVMLKVRKGDCVAFIVAERKRSELALISMVKEAIIDGISPRKVDWLARSLVIDSISASQES